ncbi:hypothetical protein HMPREF1544_00984 [Mucor circinelloides 1006PhL]|uniref:RING-type domain-containing protein n=1 Tax=Mucor circinelloides f. circinelloides (strain 1006PhL) TaxID=1220926 RepID=S2JQA0_MUCC1|nr:hypothetical protein HMPREF1544_00984 [Mucor circinelloides 1006PhL]
MNGSDIICSICLAELTLSDMPMQALNCGHVFHKDCIETWLNTTRNKCPICKQMCSKEDGQPIYLSSQPVSEPMINILRIELLEATQKTHQVLQESLEERIRLFEESLLQEVGQIHENFNQERCQFKQAEQDWLHSYTQLQTVVVVLAAYVVFRAIIETSFGALLVFFMLVEGVLLAQERNMQKLKSVISKLELPWRDSSQPNSK